MGYFDKTIKFIEETPVEELQKELEQYGVKFVPNPKVKQKLSELREFYNNLTDEEFKQRLIDAGFEIIEDGNGRIIFEEGKWK